MSKAPDQYHPVTQFLSCVFLCSLLNPTSHRINFFNDCFDNEKKEMNGHSMGHLNEKYTCRYAI